MSKLNLHNHKLHLVVVESDDSDAEKSTKKKKKNTCTLVWEVSRFITLQWQDLTNILYSA